MLRTKLSKLLVKFGPYPEIRINLEVCKINKQFCARLYGILVLQYIKALKNPSYECPYAGFQIGAELYWVSSNFLSIATTMTRAEGHEEKQRHFNIFY